MPNATWEFDNDRSKRLALGVANGDWTDFDAIVASRHARKPEIMSHLALTHSDRVLDLGSGMGLIAEVIAPEVEQLYCADVSSTFLGDCRARTAHFGNVECHPISYANLSALYGKRINKAYSTLLFIHFNFYDFVLYLKELHRVLEPGGLLYFDYNDGDRFRLDNASDSFNGHLAIYAENREHWIFECMHMGSRTLLANIAPQIGFRVVKNRSTSQCFSQMLLRKA